MTKYERVYNLTVTLKRYPLVVLLDSNIDGSITIDLSQKQHKVLTG